MDAHLVRVRIRDRVRDRVRDRDREWDRARNWFWARVRGLGVGVGVVVAHHHQSFGRSAGRRAGSAHPACHVLLELG